MSYLYRISLIVNLDDLKRQEIQMDSYILTFLIFNLKPRRELTQKLK